MTLRKYTKAESFEVVQEEGEKIASLTEAEEKYKGSEETEEEREKRIRERADEARKQVSMTPGQAETLRKAR